MSPERVIELDRLRKEFPSGRGRPPLVAVDDVSLTVDRGETLAVVGESGSGKTTLTRLLLGLLTPTSGTATITGIDPARCTVAELRTLRRGLQVVFQDPHSSMNPRMRIEDVVAEPLVTHEPRARQRSWRQARVGELLTAVGLDPSMGDRYPHEFSGGQRQRISIARALSLSPEIVVLDEPTSALDVSVQSQVLDLLAELKERLGLTYLFVSHNLAVVAQVADRVAVMRNGAVVELGTAGELFSRPQNPYTRTLLEAAPDLDPTRSRRRRSRSGAAGGDGVSAGG